jgi:predicted DNA-binding transcriptional regulator YafY
VRTLHRYFKLLDEMGIPVYTERGPYGGFSLVRGYKMPPLVFSPEEAIAVCLGISLVSEMWGQLYHEAAQDALTNLDNLLPNYQRDEVTWARRTLVTTGLYHPSLDAQAVTLEQLRHAIRESRRVNMLYQSASVSEPGVRKLDPCALALRWGWWYVIGYCHTHQEVRTFRIDRIRELSLLGEVFQTPTDFNAREFMNRSFQGQMLVQVQLRFTAEAAHIARIKRFTWGGLDEQPDGGRARQTGWQTVPAGSQYSLPTGLHPQVDGASGERHRLPCYADGSALESKSGEKGVRRTAHRGQHPNPSDG